MEISSVNETTEDLKVGLSIHYIIILVWFINSLHNCFSSYIFYKKSCNSTKQKEGVKLSSSTLSYFHCKIGKKERIFKKNYFKS